MIKVGSGDIAKVYVGSTEIAKAYVGSQLVYENVSEPVPYDAKIEYLEGTGTQWIDTDIVSTVNDAVSITLSTSNFVNSFLCGARANSSSMSGSFFIYGQVSKKVAFASNNSYTTSSVNVQDGNIHTIEHSKAGGFIDGTKVVTRSFTAEPSTRSYAIFTVNDRDTPTNIVSCKLYGFTYSRNGTILMNLIPVRVGTTGYMYDKVSGNLYGNNGSGSFTLGNDI